MEEGITLDLTEGWLKGNMNPDRRKRGGFRWIVGVALCGLLPLPLIAADVSASATAGAHPDGGTNSLSASQIISMNSLDDSHRIVAGDRLSFRVIEDQEEAKPLLVKDSGQVDFPYVGLLGAVGKTCKQLALQLKRELEKDYYYQATVIIALEQFSDSRGKVYVVGAVRAAGPQNIPSDEVFTVGKAIMRAGGFAEFADKKRVRVTRQAGPGKDKPEIFVVNVGDVLEKGKSDDDLVLKSGDIIFVRERSLNF